MARTDLERKRKTPWPWFVGLAVLALILWGTNALLTEDAETEPGLTVATVEDTNPPAAIPSPPDVEPTATGTEAARGLEEIAPLGEEDVGQTIRLDGEVVATGNDAFWLLSGGTVLRVDSERRVRTGDSLSIEGTLLRATDPEKTERIEADVLPRRPGSGDWQVLRAIKLVEDGGGETPS